jgi:16S rRNA (uracil1498-N3)-methyltransferase
MGDIMQRYFINHIQDNMIEMDKEQIKHISKVMRNHNGDEVVCIDKNKQAYLCEIKDVNNGILEIKEQIHEEHELDVDVTLIYALPKSDKFELVLQKTTELGVSRIVPFLSQRSIIKTDQKTFSKKYERYNRILKEASQQSYRLTIPTLEPLITIKQLKDYLSDVNLVAYEEASKIGEKSNFYKALNQDYQTITIIVGPEGGFDEEEIEYMKSIGIQECSLGKRILRSETAPLYMMSVIGYSRELM